MKAEVDILSKKAEVNSAKAKAKNDAMKQAIKDKEEADKLEFENTVKAATAARRKAAIAKAEVGDDQPTADEAQAAAKVVTSKQKTPPAKKTAKDEKVEAV